MQRSYKPLPKMKFADFTKLRTKKDWEVRNYVKQALKNEESRWKGRNIFQRLRKNYKKKQEIFVSSLGGF